MSEGNPQEEGIDWAELGESFGQIEEEFKAEKAESGAKDEHGVPVWAANIYQAYLESKAQHVEERHDGNAEECSSYEEDLENFIKKVVEPMEEGDVCVTVEGPKRERPSKEQTFKFELNGEAAFTLFMALKVASSSVNMAGPMALMGAGLKPNLEDALDIEKMSRALAGAFLDLADPDSDLTVIDARVSS